MLFSVFGGLWQKHWFVLIQLPIWREKLNTHSLWWFYHDWKRKSSLKYFIEPESTLECKGETKAILSARTTKTPFRDAIFDILANTTQDLGNIVSDFWLRTAHFVSACSKSYGISKVRREISTWKKIGAQKPRDITVALAKISWSASLSPSFLRIDDIDFGPGISFQLVECLENCEVSKREDLVLQNWSIETAWHFGS